VSPSGSAARLAEYLDAIEASGIALCPDQLLVIQRALAKKPSWTDDELRSILRCIVAKSRDDWATIERILKPRAVVTPAPEPLEPHVIGKRLRLKHALPALLVATLLGLVFTFRGKLTELPTVPPLEQLRDTLQVPLLNLVRAPFQLPAEAAPDFRQVVSMLGQCVLVGLFVWFLFDRVRVFRERRRPRQGPFDFRLMVQRVSADLLWQRREADVVASNLAVYGPTGGRGELDVSETVRTTTMACGFPQLVFHETRGRVPWLAFIDASHSVGWRSLVEALMQRLTKAGVDFVAVDYLRSPKSLKKDSRGPRTLRALAPRTSPALFIGDGEGAWDYVRSEPAQWLDRLRDFQPRMWLTPEGPNLGLQQIGRRMPTMPLSLMGLRALDPRRRRRAWGHTTLNAQVPHTFAEVQRVFGTVATTWLGACAIIGTPDPQVALWMLQVCGFKVDDPIRFRVLSLPWFASGHWPSPLTRELCINLRRTQPDAVRTVVDAAEQAFQKVEPPLGSHAHVLWQLARATTRARANAPGVEDDLSSLRLTPAFREARALRRASHLPVALRWRVAIALTVAASAAMAARLLPPSKDDSKPPVSASLPPVPKPASSAEPAAPPASARSGNEGVEVEVAPALLDLVLVPEGEFTMGAAEYDKDEAPPHRVHISSFWIGKREVSMGEFGPASTADASLPAQDVSWNQARAFCERNGMRLPTEAEWEYAARGTDGRMYPWGNAAPTPQLATFGQKVASPTTANVRGAGPFGTLNQAGNMWEWVEDCYVAVRYAKDQASGVVTNPLEDTSSGCDRVVRGGSYSAGERFLRSSLRNSARPSDGDPFQGFRCARSQSAPRASSNVGFEQGFPDGMTGDWLVDGSAAERGARAAHPPALRSGASASLVFNCGGAKHSSFGFYYRIGPSDILPRIQLFVDTQLLAVYPAGELKVESWNKVSLAVPLGVHSYRFEATVPVGASQSSAEFWLDTVQCR
jgi:formylglycine-generating enzyme required for sulfatase activity